MPEIPDVVVYMEKLKPRVQGQAWKKIRIASPFLLRSVDPPISKLEGRTIKDLLRIGKRIVFAFDADLYLILHLMIAGRLHWKPPDAKLPCKVGLAAFHFDHGTLTLTEAGTKKRASIHVVRRHEALKAHNPGGLEVLETDLPAFKAALLRENHTLKRSLTDPHLFSGIGNSYSDEILHAARLSPLTWTSRLTEEEIDRLFTMTKKTLL